jgi:hypothetical protein
MKAITKLLFVALLIGVALSLPSSVRASGTNGYTCNWTEYAACYDPLESWMNQCTQGCAADVGYGGSQQFCFTQITLGSFLGSYYDTTVDPPVLKYVFGPTTYSTACSLIPNNAESCVQECVNGYNQQYNACISNYCTAD